MRAFSFARAATVVFILSGCADPGTIISERPADAQLDARLNDATFDTDLGRPVDFGSAEPEPTTEPQPTPEPQPTAEPEPAVEPEPAAEPEPLAGCDQTLPTGISRGMYSHQGQLRRFRLFVPSTYDQQPTPVVLDFHGRHGNADGQAFFSGLDAVAERNGFIAVQPEGEGGDRTWNAGFCCGGAQTLDVDDVGATAALLDHLEQTACIDPDRVFATGISNGAFMAHRLACELSDRIAAIAPVAGGNMMLVCDPERPVAVLHFHGLADLIVPFEGFGGFASVPESTAGWVARNGCRTGPEVVFEEADVRCERWTDCDADATVELCRIEGGGHTWPGGPDVPGLGATTQTISASAMLWTFFEAHPRR